MAPGVVVVFAVVEAEEHCDGAGVTANKIEVTAAAEGWTGAFHLPSGFVPGGACAVTVNSGENMNNGQRGGQTLRSNSNSN